VQRVAARLENVKELCDEQKKSFSVSGGGTGGIEFFASPLRAYFIEISGGGGVQKNGIWTDSGLVLRAGNQFYF
jgi:NADH dehydrogenase FAD-containing subunit